MQSVTYSVPAIHCGHCTHTIEMELSEIDGVSSVKADQDKKEVSIDYSEPATEEQIIGTLKEINYPPEL